MLRARHAVAGLTLAALATLGPAAPDASGAVPVVGDPEHVVARRLAGTWTIDAVLAERLLGRPHGATDGAATVRFVIDPDVAARMPETLAESLAARGQVVFAAGRVAWASEPEAPFLLVEHHGQPAIITYRERRGNPYGGAQINFVAVAAAADPSLDLLLVGGDVGSRPFVPYARAAAARE